MSCPSPQCPKSRRTRSSRSQSTRSIPTGYVTNDTDCDDIHASAHPGGTEGCNGLDDDCDGIVDDGGSSLCSDADLCTTDACAGGACTFTPVVVQEVNASLAVTKSGPSAVISWADAAGPFNVYRGTRTAPAWVYNASCLDSGTSGPTPDAPLPDPGAAAWYLVSRTSACGESVLGLDSGGSPIPNASPCP